jgi:hypothetical protein
MWARGCSRWSTTASRTERTKNVRRARLFRDRARPAWDAHRPGLRRGLPAPHPPKSAAPTPSGGRPPSPVQGRGPPGAQVRRRSHRHSPGGGRRSLQSVGRSVGRWTVRGVVGGRRLRDRRARRSGARDLPTRGRGRVGRGAPPLEGPSPLPSPHLPGPGPRSSGRRRDRWAPVRRAISGSRDRVVGSGSGGGRDGRRICFRVARRCHDRAPRARGDPPLGVDVGHTLPPRSWGRDRGPPGPGRMRRSPLSAPSRPPSLWVFAP